MTAAARVSARPGVRRFHIGTAGWTIPTRSGGRCPGSGTHLERYARVFRCAEINSTFYRSHGGDTYSRWALATDRSFRFALKLPRLISHELRLQRASAALDRFLDETSVLKSRRGPLLVQLPPSLEFDARVAGRFFGVLRRRWSAFVVCEPRHASWFSERAEALLRHYHVGRVATDPTPIAGAHQPGGWPGIVYYRLHGSPRKYWSAYDEGFLEQLADALARVPASSTAWCIFDNTAGGAALENAWELQEMLRAGGRAGTVASRRSTNPRAGRRPGP
jgi:uncharacterized protein YecE (DUF72 family)